MDNPGVGLGVHVQLVTLATYHRVPAPSLVYKWPLARICCVSAIQNTQRRYAAISSGAPIQRESRPLPLITAILSGCFARAHVRREGPNPSARV